MIIPAARPGEVESKKLWGPTLYRSGEKVNNPIYDVYETVWPDDDSELSGKRLTLYFDHNQPLFPFPYWMQLKTVFELEKIPFPILVLRNSALITSLSQLNKIEQLGFSVSDFFKSEF